MDMCDVCANLVVNGKRTVDIGRCAGCANYFCDCWLESARFENDPDIYLFCNSDALGGCYVEEDEESTEASP